MTYYDATQRRGDRCCDCNKLLANNNNPIKCPYCKKSLCGGCNYINELNEFDACICGNCVVVNDVLIKKCFCRSCSSCFKEFNLENCGVSTCECVGSYKIGELFTCIKCKYNWCDYHINHSYNGDICVYCKNTDFCNIEKIEIETIRRRKLQKTG